jgi:hypothetical protein
MIDSKEEVVVQIHEYEKSGNEGFIPPSPEELKKTLWKLDLRIIPFLGLLYLCSFLDRVNIGNAKLAGLAEDLHVGASDYNIALSLFFVGYVSIALPKKADIILTPRLDYF